MRLDAWIVEEEGVGFIAHWQRWDSPEQSRQLCMTYEQARQRVERAARDLGLEIDWIAEGGF